MQQVLQALYMCQRKGAKFPVQRQLLSSVQRGVVVYIFDHVRLAERMKGSINGDKPVTSDPDRHPTGKVLHPNDQDWFLFCFFRASLLVGLWLTFALQPLFLNLKPPLQIPAGGLLKPVRKRSKSDRNGHPPSLRKQSVTPKIVQIPSVTGRLQKLNEIK